MTKTKLVLILFSLTLLCSKIHCDLDFETDEGQQEQDPAQNSDADADLKSFEQEEPDNSRQSSGDETAVGEFSDSPEENQEEFVQLDAPVQSNAFQEFESRIGKLGSGTTSTDEEGITINKRQRLETQRLGHPLNALAVYFGQIHDFVTDFEENSIRLLKFSIHKTERIKEYYYKFLFEVRHFGGTTAYLGAISFPLSFKDSYKVPKFAQSEDLDEVRKFLKMDKDDLTSENGQGNTQYLRFT